MKERPILFSAPMVRAILDGRKTQTRRAAKVSRVDSYPDQPLWKIVTLENGRQGWLNAQAEHPHHITSLCPYGQPGDRLWVKETTIKVEDHGYTGPCYVESDEGRAVLEYGLSPSPDDFTEIEPQDIRKRPAIHMPRAMSRILLEITAVRVERLNEISQSDARAEGAPPSHPSIDRVSRVFGFADFPRSWFGQLWDQINGPGSWDANPWVWVIEFNKI